MDTVIMEFEIQDFDVLRMMEKAGVEAGWSSEKMQQWFTETRQPHQCQADYVDRLSRLRKDLIHQEQENLNMAMERLKIETLGKERAKSKTKAKKQQKENLAESFPVRQRKILQEKMERGTRKEVVKCKSPPKLDALEGVQIVEPPAKSQSGPHISSKPKPKSEPCLTHRFLSKSADDARLVNLQKLLHPSRSIPNIGRRALKQPNKLTPLKPEMEQKSSSSFIKQMSIHQKDFRTGLYNRVAKRNPKKHPKGYTELSVTSRSYDKHKFAIEAVLQAQGGFYPRQQYQVPSTTPVPNYEFLSDSETESSDDEEYISTTKKVAFSDGTTPTATASSTPTFRLKKLNDPESVEFREYVRQKRLKSTSRKSKASVAKKAFAECDNFAQEHEPEFFSRAQTCCTITSAKSNFSARSSRELNGHTPSISRKELVVEMPNIAFIPPTPDVYSKHNNGHELLNTRNKSLVKTVRQNELRNKEIKDLLEDVEELNHITNELETKLLVKSDEKSSVLQNVQQSSIDSNASLDTVDSSAEPMN